MDQHTIDKVIALSEERKRLQEDFEQFNKLHVSAEDLAREAHCNGCMRNCSMCEYKCRVQLSYVKLVAAGYNSREVKLCHQTFSDLIEYAKERIGCRLTEINKELSAL